MMRRPGLATILAALALPGAAAAQTAADVAPYQAPPPAGIVRDGAVLPPVGTAPSGDSFRARPDLVGAFAAAYARHKRPRLALYWNQQFSATLDEWYADTRVVSRTDRSDTVAGTLNLQNGPSGSASLNHTGTSESTLEVQRRVADHRRTPPSESFEWEFQDGFLAPFLEAGASVIDRATIIRLTGADLPGSSSGIIETRALQGKADLLMEVLAAPSGQSTVGYELRARIIEVATGRILAFVNSKGLREWTPDKEALATGRGFELPDEDEETFGPAGSDRYKATGSGFERRRKPPKLNKIAENLAYNVMDDLLRQWK